MIKYKYQKATVINRPSKIIKSPYMVDILYDDNEYLAHSPALSLNKLINNGTIIMISESDNDKTSRKSKYTIEFVKLDKIWIGVNPLFANKLFIHCVNNKILTEFDGYFLKKAEIKTKNGRLDFLLHNKDNDIGVVTPTKEYFVEIKNVPLAKDNVAIFPFGKKNKKTDIYISERAYKHLKELILLKKHGFNVALVFIIQRNDIEYLIPNYEHDYKYAKTLEKAYKLGVNIYAYKFNVKSNNIQFMTRIPINFIN